MCVMARGKWWAHSQEMRKEGIPKYGSKIWQRSRNAKYSRDLRLLNKLAFSKWLPAKTIILWIGLDCLSMAVVHFNLTFKTIYFQWSFHFAGYCTFIISKCLIVWDHKPIDVYSYLCKPALGWSLKGTGQYEATHQPSMRRYSAVQRCHLRTPFFHSFSYLKGTH